MTCTGSGDTRTCTVRGRKFKLRSGKSNKGGKARRAGKLRRFRFTKGDAAACKRHGKSKGKAFRTCMGKRVEARS